MDADSSRQTFEEKQDLRVLVEFQSIIPFKTCVSYKEEIKNAIVEKPVKQLVKVKTFSIKTY